MIATSFSIVLTVLLTKIPLGITLRLWENAHLPFGSPFDRLTVLSKVEGLTALSNVEGSRYLHPPPF